MADPLAGRQIVLGVTGGIAAYKAVEVLRRLTERGAQVQVVMTEAAEKFITPNTFRSLSSRPVLGDLWAEPERWEIQHVSLGEWAQLVIVAPATANSLAKLAHGLGDNLLTTLVLATKAPVLIAPAMNDNMLSHPATQANLAQLKKYGYHFVASGYGRLASGKVGAGRLAETETIIAEAEKLLSPQDFAGKKVVITAGPTRETIDPVRFITNPSSGKMGYALAACARRRGAQVTLISGPTSLPAPVGVELLPVTSAAEMYDAALQQAPGAQIFIGAAAVGDFTPAKASDKKLKKSGELSLRLTQTQDIITAVSGLKRKRPKLVVGFAAENHDLLANGKKKLVDKGLDLVVANDISQPEVGFASDYNTATLLFPGGKSRALTRQSKIDLADEIFDTIKPLLKNR